MRCTSKDLPAHHEFLSKNTPARVEATHLQRTQASKGEPPLCKARAAELACRAFGFWLLCTVPLMQALSKGASIEKVAHNSPCCTWSALQFSLYQAASSSTAALLIRSALFSNTAMGGPDQSLHCKSKERHSESTDS